MSDQLLTEMEDAESPSAPARRALQVEAMAAELTNCHYEIRRLQAALGVANQLNRMRPQQYRPDTELVALMDGSPSHTRHCEPTAMNLFQPRCAWLVGLMLLQSLSSLVLQHFGHLLALHPVVVYYLTMLIGAGGNVGAQSAVLAVRDLATGSLSPKTSRQFIRTQLLIGLQLGAVLMLVAGARTWLLSAQPTSARESAGIALTMFSITFAASGLGASLPILLKQCGSDPAHAMTSIQVLMDISGVIIACVVCRLVLGPN